MNGGIEKSWGGRYLKSFIPSVEIVVISREGCCLRQLMQGIGIYTLWAEVKRVTSMEGG
jgi:hypothetical protein